MQGIFEPSTRHVLEERVKDDREADESGDPPDAGRSGPVQHGDPAAARMTSETTTCDIARLRETKARTARLVISARGTETGSLSRVVPLMAVREKVMPQWASDG